MRTTVGFRLVLPVLALFFVGIGVAVAQQTGDSYIKHKESANEKQPPARRSYMGRTIAQTMHYLGAPWLTRESREREEDAKTMFAQFGIKPGMTVCDVGCGNGFYTLPMAEAVGEKGKVYAVDIQVQMLRLLRKRALKQKIDNIEYILGTYSNPKLPDNSCDIIILVDAYHEFSHPVHMLKHMRRALKPGGRMILVEFRMEDPNVPIKLLHKMSKQQIMKEVPANGFKLVRQFDKLPWQHMMYFERDDAFPWPQMLGPSRNGQYVGQPILDKLPAKPTVRWKRPIGEGFAGPIVVGDRLILFHRQNNKDIVDCISLSTNKPLWSTSYPTNYVDNFGQNRGPRATPTVAHGKVFTFGAQGILQCLDLKTGDRDWQVDTAKQFHTSKGFFGRACSPVVEGDHVLLNIGGQRNNAGIVAFHRKTGKVVWQATDHRAGYSSPTVGSIGKHRVGFVFTRRGLIAVNPASGKTYFDLKWRSGQDASVNAATPLVLGNHVYISSAYETGDALLAIDPNDPSKYSTVWSGNNAMSSQYVTPVHRDGYLYGFTGRHDFDRDTKLRCVELKSGKVMWTSRHIPGGPIILAGDQLIIVRQDGVVQMVKASPNGFTSLGEASVLASTTRAPIALADGLLLARDEKQLVCIDLAAKPDYDQAD